MPVPSVVAVAQLPPPVTGLSAVSQRLVDLLTERGLLSKALNIGPPAGSPGWLRLPIRAMRTCLAAIALAPLKAKGASTLYMSTDSKSGLILNILLTLVARALSYRVVFHHHNFSYIDRRSSLMQRLIQVAPKETVHVLLCTVMRDRFKEAYRESWRAAGAQAFVLPNTFMASSTQAQDKPEGMTIGHLSNLTAEKGALRFIALFRRLREAGLPIRAELAGPCQTPEILRAIEAASRDHPDTFNWTGAVYGDQKADFYRRTHVFVFPTSYPNEAQPLVLLEALASGCAILTTAIGCIACDHTHSPGGVFTVRDFDDAAFNWLSAQAKEGSWETLFAADALDAFRSQNSDGVAALHKLLESLS